MNDAIVNLDVTALVPNGNVVELAARIGRAEPEGDAWTCAVELEPVYQQPVSVKGVDSFHATWLACSLVLKLLGALRDEGVELRSADGSAFPLEGYLAGLGAPPPDAAGG